MRITNRSGKRSSAKVPALYVYILYDSDNKSPLLDMGRSSTVHIMTLVHILALKVQPTAVYLAATKNTVASRIDVPTKSCVYKYLPLSFEIKAPEMDGPLSTAKATIEKHIPILTPAFIWSFVRLVRTAGNMP